MGSGVRNHEVGIVKQRASVCDQVEVKGARRVGLDPLTAKGLFNASQRAKRPVRPQGRLDKHNAVAILRPGRVGPGSGPPPRRPGDDVQTRAL